MRVSKQLIFASSNRDKLKELQPLFTSYLGVELVPVEVFIRNSSGLDHVEKYNTYLENASAKARLANHGVHYPCLADDSGLEVECLDWQPGVKTRRYASPKKGMTQSQANIEFLLQEMGHSSNRFARMVCCLVLIVEGVLIHNTGVMEGEIVSLPSYNEKIKKNLNLLNGFGYDPVFIPKGYDQTLAEMTLQEKNKISHRTKAFHELMSQIRSKGLVFAKP